MFTIVIFVVVDPHHANCAQDADRAHHTQDTLCGSAQNANEPIYCAESK